MSVKYRRPNYRTDHDHIWQAYADRPGVGSYQTKLTPHPRGVEVGILGGSTNQKSGKCHELSRKKMLTHPGGPGVGGGGWGQRFKSAGNFTNCRQNRYKKVNPHPTPSDGGGGGVRGENFKVTKHQVLKSISGMQLSWAKPGNPREGG